MTTKLEQIADNADLIINGYAFTRKGENVSVLNLNKPLKDITCTSPPIASSSVCTSTQVTVVLRKQAPQSSLFIATGAQSFRKKGF